MIKNHQKNCRSINCFCHLYPKDGTLTEKDKKLFSIDIMDSQLQQLFLKSNKSKNILILNIKFLLDMKGDYYKASSSLSKTDKNG